MKKLTFLLICFGFLGWGYRIMTGSTTGTYYKIGENIRDFIARPVGIKLEVKPSHGSLDNLTKMILDPESRFAIVQQDVIEIARKNKNISLRAITRNLKLLLPLYIEEVHLIVRKESPYRHFEDLKGKVAGIVINSGSALTTRVLLKRIFNTPNSFKSLNSFQEGLEKLERGEIEWVIAVCGQPCSKIKQLDGNKFRLLPFDPNKQYGDYSNCFIDNKNYPNLHLTAPLPTIGVRSLLVIYDDSDPNVMSDVRKLAVQFYRSKKILQKQGHPKWKQVSFELTKIAGWKYYTPFKDGWRIGFDTLNNKVEEKLSIKDVMVNLNQ